MASLCTTPLANAAGVFTLTSSAFEDNGTLAVKNAGSDKQRSPNCVGENISPPLAWSNAPEGTKSFALLMFDPEGRAPAGVSHMVVYGIPASVTGFAEGELSKPSDKYVGGKNLRQESDGSGDLYRPVYAAQHRLAPLHADPGRDRPRPPSSSSRGRPGSISVMGTGLRRCGRICLTRSGRRFEPSLVRSAPRCPPGMRFASTFEEGLHAPFYATTREIEAGTVRGAVTKTLSAFHAGVALE